MKLLSRRIALLVIFSLTGIFAYQAYWLTGLYRTMSLRMEQSIHEAMRLSDYNEMMCRIRVLQQDSVEHGEVNVNASFSEEENTYVYGSSVVSRSDNQAGDTLTISMTARHTSQELATSEPDAALITQNNNLVMIMRQKNNLQELATYFQRGLHSGIDVLSEPSLCIFDSLLTLQLQEVGIRLPHCLEYLHRGSNADSSYSFVDTLATACTPGYLPTRKARSYEYDFDVHSNYLYRLTMEPISSLVLGQMTGILVTSFIILLILGFSFWFLIRTILQQKTIEEMKSDFTNNITHELKTPIAVAYAANDALLNFDRAADKQLRDKYLRICQEQLQRLSALVEQILAMSMERRRTFSLHREELPIHNLLLALVEQHQLKAEKPVDIRLSVVPEGMTVRADHTHFTNIISNLIDNAIKYSPGKAEVEIACRSVVHKSAEGQQAWMELTVSDHGIGIAPDRQRHIFRKFYRVPTGNLHDVKGYGLGLFYVKTMVEKHGGSVEVQSKPGRGSRFTVKIPMT